MDQKLSQDIFHYFSVFEDRTSALLQQMPYMARQQMEDEINTLRQVILDRLKG